MTGSIRLYVATALAAGRHHRRDGGAGALPRAPSCAAGLATTVLLFNGRDGEFAARIETIRRDRASLRVERPDPSPGAGARSVAGIRTAEARRHRSRRAEGDRTGRRRTASGDHRAQQHAPDKCGPARRHRHRGGGAVRTPDRAAAARSRGRSPRCCATGQPTAACSPPSSAASAPRITPTHGPRALLVGPEGGFTPAELEAMRAHPFVTAVIARPAHPAGRDRLHRRAGIVAGGGLPL